MASVQRHLTSGFPGRRLAAAATFCVATVLVAPPVLAQDLTTPEWEARLADTVKGGPPPIAVTVDGRAVDTSLLGTGPDQAARAAAALGGRRFDQPPADELRRRAEQIVSEPAYTGQPESIWRRWLTENPVTRWLRETWDRIVRWIMERFSLSDGERDPGQADLNRRSYGVPLILIVAAGAAILTMVTVRRSRRFERDQDRWFEGVDEGLRSRAALEDEARSAEARGAYSDAVRYRFLAGLLRLDEADRIRFWPSSRLMELREQMDSDDFDRAAELFECAAYSPRAATADDAVAHNAAWDSILGIRVGP